MVNTVQLCPRLAALYMVYWLVIVFVGLVNIAISLGGGGVICNSMYIKIHPTPNNT